MDVSDRPGTADSSYELQSFITKASLLLQVSQVDSAFGLSVHWMLSSKAAMRQYLDEYCLALANLPFITVSRMLKG